MSPQAAPVRPTRPRRAATRTSLVGLTPLLLLLLVWQLAGNAESVLYPRPSRWWDGFTALLATGQFGPSLRATVTTFLLAMLAATLLGALLGALVGSFALLDRATAPAFTFLMSIPPAAIVPVAVLVVGIGLTLQIGAVIFAAIWPILLNTAAAMRAVPTARLDSARMLGLPRSARVARVVLPSLVPGIAVGVLVAAPVGIVVTLLVEMLTTVPGLGSMLLASQRSFQSTEVFAMLVVIGLLGYSLNVLVRLLQSRLLRNWPTGY